MKSTASALVAAVLFVAGYLSITPVAQRAAEQAARRPGPQQDGSTLLPNGWRIAPVGKHLKVGDLPLAFTWSPDGRYLIVTNNGYTGASLSVVDARTFTVTQTVQLDYAWLGLAWHPDGTRLYSTGQDVVHELAWSNGTVSHLRSFALPKSRTSLGGGLAVSRDGRRLYATRALEQVVLSIDIERGTVTKSVTLPAEAYSCVLSPDGTRLFVSLWGGARVLAFDPETLTQVGEVAVGEHPNAMAVTADGKRLFVACANTNAVWAIDAQAMTATEQIGVSMFPKAPAGSTPNGLGLSPDGRTLLVANADNNIVASVDVSTPGKGRAAGFIPTGWYPTAATFDSTGHQIYILSGKGLASVANPAGPSPLTGKNDQYIAGLLIGAVTVVPTPDVATLGAYDEEGPSACRRTRTRFD